MELSSDEYTRLQQLLDILGTQPGSILVRGPDRWIALQPGQVGDILMVNNGGMPQWVPPETIL